MNKRSFCTKKYDWNIRSYENKANIFYKKKLYYLCRINNDQCINTRSDVSI